MQTNLIVMMNLPIKVKVSILLRWLGLSEEGKEGLLL